MKNSKERTKIIQIPILAEKIKNFHCYCSSQQTPQELIVINDDKDNKGPSSKIAHTKIIKRKGQIPDISKSSNPCLWNILVQIGNFERKMGCFRQFQSKLAPFIALGNPFLIFFLKSQNIPAEIPVFSYFFGFLKYSVNYKYGKFGSFSINFGSCITPPKLWQNIHPFFFCMILFRHKVPIRFLCFFRPLPPPPAYLFLSFTHLLVCFALSHLLSPLSPLAIWPKRLDEGKKRRTEHGRTNRDQVQTCWELHTPPTYGSSIHTNKSFHLKNWPKGNFLPKKSNWPKNPFIPNFLFFRFEMWN